MVLKYVRLEDVLHEGQNYVALAKNVKAVEHSIATSTCFEKKDLLDSSDPSGEWTDDRIVKAVFLYWGKDVYGFVFPELGKRPNSLKMDARAVLPNLLGISKSQSKRFSNGYCLDGMEYGTCTPFVLDTELDGFEMKDRRRVRGMFIHDCSHLEDKIVDISIGGSGSKAHRTSLHLPYQDIYDILNSRFPGKVEKVCLV